MARSSPLFMVYIILFCKPALSPFCRVVNMYYLKKLEHTLRTGQEHTLNMQYEMMLSGDPHSTRRNQELVQTGARRST